MKVIERLINLYGVTPVVLFGLLIVVAFVSLIATIIYCARIAIRIEHTYEYEDPIEYIVIDDMYLHTDAGMSEGYDDSAEEEAQNRRQSLRVVGGKRK